MSARSFSRYNEKNLYIMITPSRMAFSKKSGNIHWIRILEFEYKME